MELKELLVLLHRESQLYFTWSFVLYYGVVLFLAWQFYKIIIKPQLNPLLKQLPHKPFRPFVGNFLEIANEEAIAPYSRWVCEYKASLLVYHGWFGSVRILSADRHFMKHVLVTNSRNYTKPAFLFRRLRDLIGNGLIISEGEVHHSHRKLCNGSFRQGILQNFVPVMEKYSRGMCELWLKKVQENVGQEYMEISPTDGLTCMTLDTIGECGFGYHFNSLNNPDAADVLAFQRMLGVFGFSYKLLIPFFTNLPTAEKRQWDSDLKLVNSCVTTVITNKKKILSTITEDDQVSDLLTSLLMARDEATGQGLSSQEIRDHVFTFMVAGHETTSTALLWCLLCLSQNPDIQERLRSEVKAVKGPLTWDKVEQLRYLNAVTKETLRLYPPVSLTFRQTQNHDKFGDVFIPQGTVVNLSIGALHRNPEYWDDPMTFNPDRFMDDSTVKPYTFLPFIAGPRMCIGYKFALIEMKIALVVLLQKLKFQPIPGKTYKCKQRITMRPNPSLELGVSEVK